MSLDASRAEETLARFRAQKPEAARLAELVSLATRIEPGLLREARLLLEPRLDASTEADLWFSPLVESWSARAFVLHPTVARLLQVELLKDAERAHRAWSLIDRLHQQVPPIVAIEERVTWMALRQGPDALPGIERQLQRVLYTMVQDEKQGLGVARWVMRALPRFPKAVRELHLARMLAFGAAARLGTRTLLEGTGAVSVIPEGGQWLLSGADLTESLPVRFELSAAGLTFLPPEASYRGHVLPIPATKPPLLEFIWKQGDEEQHRIVIPEPDRSVPIPGNVASVWLRTVSGDEFELLLRLDEHAPASPRDLDPAIWQSCAWIARPKRNAVAYFIEPRILASAAEPFELAEIGTSMEAHWNHVRLTVTLVERSVRENVALFELMEELVEAKPLSPRITSTDVIYTTIHPDDPGTEHWIAYDLSEGAHVWVEGTFDANPFRHPDRNTGFILLHRSPPPRQVSQGAPILMGGAWAGHYVRSKEAEVTVCLASSVQEVLSRWRQEQEEEAEQAAMDSDDRRLEEMWEFLRERRSTLEEHIREGVEQQLDKHPEIESSLFPSESERGTIREYRGWRISLVKESLQLEGGTSALLDAIAESDEVHISLYMGKSNRALRDDEESRFTITDPDWNDQAVEAECVVSLRLVAQVQVETELLDAGVLEIAGVAVTGIDDIEVLEIHDQSRVEDISEVPPEPPQQGSWSASVSGGGHVLTATVSPARTAGIYSVRIVITPVSPNHRIKQPVTLSLKTSDMGVSTRRVKPVNGSVELEVEALGAFTVKAKPGKVALFLNLANIHGVPEDFRAMDGWPGRRKSAKKAAPKARTKKTVTRKPSPRTPKKK